jgi:hypothetical protein
MARSTVTHSILSDIGVFFREEMPVLTHGFSRQMMAVFLYGISLILAQTANK